MFLTFAQFLYVTIQTVSSQIYFPAESKSSRDGLQKKGWIPRIRKRQVPIKRWLVQVFLFLGVSLSELIVRCPHSKADRGVNNYAFGLKVSARHRPSDGRMLITRFQ